MLHIEFLIKFFYSVLELLFSVIKMYDYICLQNIQYILIHSYKLKLKLSVLQQNLTYLAK